VIKRLREHVLSLVGDRHPIWRPEGLEQAERYLTKQFQSLDLVVTTHQFQALGGTYRNVVATLPAARSSDPEPPLIVAAHYDTIPLSPGADDNASGLAVMLEVARSLRTVSLCRPVRFIAFCLEEEDLLGSLAYAAYLRATNQEILGAIVLECVGCASTEEGSQQTPPGLPFAVPTVGDFLALVGNQASSELVTAIEQSAKQHVPDLKTIPLVVPGQGELLPDTRRSDHAAFWHHGYPAVMLTDTANYRNPHYHMPTDVIETLDFDFMDKVASTVVAACLELAREGSELHFPMG
jgi:Zn-dependent M28 family amino/carboxypeptidase